jgi:hypothetical protein
MTLRHRDRSSLAFGSSFPAAPPSAPGAAVLTPHSGIRLAPAEDVDDPTVYEPLPMAMRDALAMYEEGVARPSVTRLGPFEIAREPATEPHLVAADPFDDHPPPAARAKTSETRLEIAGAPAARPESVRTLCSIGVVHPDAESTRPCLPAGRAPASTAAPAPSAAPPAPPPARRFGLMLALSELALRAALSIGRAIAPRVPPRPS